jgi:hypothetical protein
LRKRLLGVALREEDEQDDEQLQGPECATGHDLPPSTLTFSSE